MLLSCSYIFNFSYFALWKTFLYDNFNFHFCGEETLPKQSTTILVVFNIYWRWLSLSSTFDAQCFEPCNYRNSPIFSFFCKCSILSNKFKFSLFHVVMTLILSMELISVRGRRQQVVDLFCCFSFCWLLQKTHKIFCSHLWCNKKCW